MKYFLLATLLFTSTLGIYAQKTDTDIVRKYVEGGNQAVRKVNSLKMLSTEETFLKQLSASFSIGSMGMGLEAATPISSSLKIRAGVYYWPASFSLSKKINVNDAILKQRIDGDYTPRYDVSFKPSLFNGSLLLDYYPSASSSFRITAGVFVGTSELKAEGYLLNPATGERSVLSPEYEEEGWPTLNVEGYALNIDNGELNVDIRMGSAIKPYVGIGFGHIFPKEERLNCSFDIGLAYQGDYTIRQYGRKADAVVDYTSSAIDIEKYAKYVKVWPVASLKVVYRIF